MSFTYTILLHDVSFYPWLLGFTHHLQGLGFLHPQFQIPNASPDDKTVMRLVGGQGGIMPTTLLLAHPDLKTQQHLCKRKPNDSRD